MILGSRSVVLTSLVLFLAAPFFCLADAVLKTGELVSLKADESVQGNYYVMAEKAIFSGKTAGDIYAVAYTVTVDGDIKSDFVSVVGTVNLHNPIGGDVRLLTGEAKIAGPVAGDVFVIGGKLHILSTASIAGDVFAFGKDVIIDGEVLGSVRGGYESLRIDSKVHGDVDVKISEELVLGSKTHIVGNVFHQGENDIVRAANAVVDGQVVSSNMMGEDDESGMSLNSWIIQFFSIFLCAFILSLLLKPNIKSMIKVGQYEFLKSSLVGLAFLFGMPVLIFVSFATIIGFPIGLALLGLAILAIVLAAVLLPIFIGSVIAEQIQYSPRIGLVPIILGSSVILLVSAIPKVGEAICLYGVVVVLGALSLRVYRVIKKTDKDNGVATNKTN